MEIAPIAGAAEVQGPSSTDDVFAGQFIGKEGFLKLLITQLQNQDPLDPMKNEEFAAQLAQFSSLEQMQNLNENFTQMMDLSKVSSTASLIGKEVIYRDQETGDSITGVVDKVILDSGGTYFSIGGKKVLSDHIQEIGPATTKI